MQGVKEMVLNTQRANKSKVKQNIDVVLRNGISNMNTLYIGKLSTSKIGTYKLYLS